MNIFVLNTGRCGSTTFIQACRHITNFSAAHESLATQTGPARFAYPDNHIEADNRLSWLLGRLEQHYGNDAWYVHLYRDREATARSFEKRMQLDIGILPAYRDGILMGADASADTATLTQDYVDTVESNIALFLKDKRHVMAFRLEQAQSDFLTFWEWIGAEGDRERALAEWQTSYNASR